jgi:hypothetical protein
VAAVAEKVMAAEVRARAAGREAVVVAVVVGQAEAVWGAAEVTEVAAGMCCDHPHNSDVLWSVSDDGEGR